MFKYLENILTITRLKFLEKLCDVLQEREVASFNKFWTILKKF